MGKEKKCTTELLCLAMGKEKKCTTDLLCLAMGTRPEFVANFDRWCISFASFKIFPNFGLHFVKLGFISNCLFLASP